MSGIIPHFSPSPVSSFFPCFWRVEICLGTQRGTRDTIEIQQTAGSLPPKKHKLVVAWIEIHQEDLMADWKLAVIGQNPLPIRGLDQ
jgi:hypothetical protein